MAPFVRFVDTSVLCNLLDVPGKNQHVAAVRKEQVEYVGSGDTLILPITSVIETGNHVAQLGGHHRRLCAERLDGVLRLSVANKTPYVFHAFSWDSRFVDRLLTGANTGTSLVEHAASGLGGGDLCILTEMETYKQRAALAEVTVWTRDAQLAAWVL